MKKITTFFLMFLFCVMAFAQQVELIFSGRNATDNSHLKMSRVEITNHTKGWSDVLYLPDTVAVLTVGTSIDEYFDTQFGFSQNRPNPFQGQTEAFLTVSEPGDLWVSLVDMNGRKIAETSLPQNSVGNLHFVVNVATPGIYVLSTRQDGKVSSIKLISTGFGSRNTIECQGVVGNVESRSVRGDIQYAFDLGDEFSCQGFLVVGGVEYVGEIENLQVYESEEILLHIQLDGNPCPGASTVTDIEGNVYNTVRIGNQCWMKENLRSSRYPNGDTIVVGTDTSSVNAYRYIPNHDTVDIERYGYLYNWVAVMNGETEAESSTGFVQGVCPDGWHVPTDQEWYQMNLYVANQDDYTCGDAASNIAKALAATEDWDYFDGTCAVGNNLSANNATGFSVLPAGYYTFNGFTGDYYPYGQGATFGCSSQYDSVSVYYRYLRYDNTYIGRDIVGHYASCSVRCIRDVENDDSQPSIDGAPCPGSTTVTDIDGNVYKTIQVGEQCWMKENLRTTRTPDGMEIPQGTSGSSTEPLLYCPDHNPDNVQKFGYLYNWTATMNGGESSNLNPSGVQGICPDGWHLPSFAEWDQLLEYIGGQDHYICGANEYYVYIAKAMCDTSNWRHSNYICAPGYDPSSNNLTGFSVRPAGSFTPGSSEFMESASFWTTSFYNQETRTHVHCLTFDYSYDNVHDNGILGLRGNSVRCVRD